MPAPRSRYRAVSCRRTALCRLHAPPHGVRSRYGFYRACPHRDTKSEKCLRGGRLPALMERIAPGASPDPRQSDLVGTTIFWLTIAVTICTLLPFALFPIMRAWLGCAVLLMWACFFTANAVRSRRTHSVISAPVYLLAAALLAANASGLVMVDVWMVWILGAGIIAANLSERFLGRYL